LHLASFFYIVNRSKRAGNRTNFATHASGFIHHFGASRFVHCDGFDWARMQTPRFVTLRTGVGDFFTGMVEIKHLDTRFSGSECAVVLKRTRHFALHTACAFVCVDMQRFLHA
jgi:hypothetical protein